MLKPSEQQVALASHINSLGIALFDRWCECRNVIPLAYLMHAWPLVAPSLPTIDRLSQTLRELLTNHAHSLAPDDREIIDHMISCLNTW
ncbi:hypothetical protein [Burkholderia ubonensis]|uniref:hypothetical protein n=1 Tax=Burkholderia ubonensis TaxID=101571 RepID=UPI002ABD35C2|nr:hypothetical protein [Burkholderia ubonensis]